MLLKRTGDIVSRVCFGTLNDVEIIIDDDPNGTVPDSFYDGVSSTLWRAGEQKCHEQKMQNIFLKMGKLSSRFN